MLAQSNVVEKIRNQRVLVIGDAMLDRYYFAEVTRISPEGPVPVALVKDEKRTLGGAANVAHNLALLGCRVSLAAISGDDENRGYLIQKLDKAGIEHTNLLKTANRPTTTKLRVIGGHQQMLRLDFEKTEALTTGQEKKLRDGILKQLDEDINAVLLSDYAKGVCTTEICTSVIHRCHERNIPLVVDPKGTHWKKYSGASLVTPNVKELGEVAGAKIMNTDEQVAKWANKVRQKFDFQAIAVTRSEKGLSLLTDDAALHIPTYAQEVFDVSGAGDTVAAVLAASLAAKIDLVSAVHLANLAAGLVVGKLGTYAISHTELAEALARMSQCEELKKQ